MMRNAMGRLLRAAAFAALVAGAPLAGTATAESLTDALIRAYQTSPLLQESRAALRGLDEGVPQARSRMRPQVGLGASAARSWDTRLQEVRSCAVIPDPDTGCPPNSVVTSSFESTVVTDTYRAGLDASLLLYDYGQTAAAVEAARMIIAAGRANLLDVEQIVLYRAVAAYVDVLRDIEFVGLARADVGRLGEQFDAATSRFEVGEFTRADVSQTEARLSASDAQLIFVQGQLEVSRQRYLQAVGSPPGNLEPLPPIPELPRTLTDAQSIANRQSPTIIAAQFNERAAVYDFDRARAASGIQLNATASAGYLNVPSGDDTSAEIGLSASVPLYTGGRNSSLVRQAQSIVERRQAELQSAGRDVQLGVSSAWIQLDTARAALVAVRQQIEAAQIAFNSISEEANLGLRTNLDVLDANQELLDSQVELVIARRNEYLAAYNVLLSMGLLTVAHLNLGIESYNPDVNFRAVRPGPVGGFDTSVVDRIRSRWEN
jgi:outer membrane protein